MATMQSPSDSRVQPQGPRRVTLRHLGRGETTLLRDSDVMWTGLRVGLRTISATSLGIVSSVPLKVGEQLKVRLRNDVQRFRAELRGAVRKVKPAPGTNGGWWITIEIFTRLMPLDVMMLRRAGVADVVTTGRIWV